MLRAMRDELARSRKLSLVNLDTPYYIEYTLDDVRSFNVPLAGRAERQDESRRGSRGFTSESETTISTTPTIRIHDFYLAVSS